MSRLLVAAALPLLLGACGSPEEAAPEPPPAAMIAAPRTLIAADFDPAMLGARIVGPQGPQVESTLTPDGHEFGEMTSFVTCPAETEICDPGNMPDDTLYTYVHRVTLSQTSQGDAPEEQSTKSDPRPAMVEAGATLFRTTRAATGFNGSIGYSKAEAEAALGSREAITVSSDAGQLIWRVTSGEGWKPGSMITFYWKSTVPPEGPAEAYLLEVDGTSAAANGPFPPEEAPASAAN